MRCFRTIINFLLVALQLLFIYSCGEGTIELGQNTYEPKIVIDGYLYPGQKVQKIKITRNIPLNTKNDPAALFLTGADVKLIDVSAGKEYKLTFNPQKLFFEYNGNDLTIGFDRSYQLAVTANIDGRKLSASAITRVPKSGFRIIDQLTTSQPMSYRELDSQGEIKNLTVGFTPSSGTDFYLFSMVALNASDSTFNYNNAYVEVKAADVKKELDRYRYQLRWLQNINSLGNQIQHKLDWINFWFYSDYRIIVYACDDNFRLFVQTYRNVQEFDGNFHEPRINIQGDGIGIFGSAIADTVYVKVKK